MGREPPLSYASVAVKPFPRWFPKAWLEQLDAKGSVVAEHPLLPGRPAGIGNAPSDLIRFPPARPSQQVASVVFSEGFVWRLREPSGKNTRLASGAVLAFSDAPAPRFVFREQPMPELDAGWKAIAQAPEDESRWFVQIDALQERNHPLGARMVEDGLRVRPEGSSVERHFSFTWQKWLRNERSAALPSEHLLALFLAEPMSIFLRTLHFEVVPRANASAQKIVNTVLFEVARSPLLCLKEVSFTADPGVDFKLPQPPGLRVTRAT